MNLTLVSEDLKNTNMLQRKGLVITRYPGQEVCPPRGPATATQTAPLLIN